MPLFYLFYIPNSFFFSQCWPASCASSTSAAAYAWFIIIKRIALAADDVPLPHACYMLHKIHFRREKHWARVRPPDPHKHCRQLNWGVLGSARSAAVLTAQAKSEVKWSVLSGSLVFADLAAGRHADPVHSTPAPFERNQTKTKPSQTKRKAGKLTKNEILLLLLPHCCFTFIDSLSRRFLASRARTCALDTNGRFCCLWFMLPLVAHKSWPSAPLSHWLIDRMSVLLSWQLASRPHSLA